jgi:hypothetical protein
LDDTHADRAEQETPIEVLRALAATRPDLGLELDGSGAGFAPLGQIPPVTLDHWLTDTATLAEGIDERTAAAYLLSILVWKLGEVVAALYLRGAVLTDTGVRHKVSGAGRSRDIQFRFAVSSTDSLGQALDSRSANQSVVDLHAPLVARLHQRTGLSKQALWRLVTDGIAGGFLEQGKRSGRAEHAREQAVALLSAASSPLHNRQWRFVEIAADGAPSQWFRLRGGCCRLYRSVGGELCTTCVLRPPDEQVARLRAFVARHHPP